MPEDPPIVIQSWGILSEEVDLPIGIIDPDKATILGSKEGTVRLFDLDHQVAGALLGMMIESDMVCIEEVFAISN